MSSVIVITSHTLLLLAFLLFSNGFVRTMPANMFGQQNFGNDLFDGGNLPSAGFDAPRSFDMSAPPALLSSSFDDLNGSPSSTGGGGTGKSGAGVSGSGGGIGGGNGSKKPSGINAVDFNLGFGINGNDFVGDLTAGADQLLKQNTGSLSSSSGLTDAVELTPGDLQHASEINSGIVVATAIGIGGGPLTNNNYAQGQATAIAAGKNTAAAGSGSAKAKGGVVNTNTNGQVVINRPDSGRQSTVLATNFNNAGSTGNSNANANSLSFVGDNLQSEFDATKQLSNQQQQDQLKFNNFNAFPAQQPSAFGQPDRGIVGNHAQSVLNTLPRNQQNAFNAITGFDKVSRPMNRRDADAEHQHGRYNRPQQHSQPQGQSNSGSKTINDDVPPTPAPVAVSSTVLSTSSTSMSPAITTTFSNPILNTAPYTPLPTTATVIATTPEAPTAALRPAVDTVGSGEPQKQPGAAVDGTASLPSSNNSDSNQPTYSTTSSSTTSASTTSAGQSSTAGGAAVVSSNTGNALVNSVDSVPANKGLAQNDQQVVESTGNKPDARRRPEEDGPRSNHYQRPSYNNENDNENQRGGWPNEPRGRDHQHFHHHWRRPNFDRNDDNDDDDRRRAHFQRREYYNN